MSNSTPKAVCKILRLTIHVNNEQYVNMHGLTFVWQKHKKTLNLTNRFGCLGKGTTLRIFELVNIPPTF